MNILAITVITLVLIGLVLEPSSFGEERRPYGYGTWIVSVLEALLVIPLALRVLGII